MTRKSTLILAAFGVLAAGCDREFDGEFAHRSQLERSTKGVTLFEDGENGHAGMMSYNCPFETRYGTVTGDYDMPDDDEEVQDSGSHVLGDSTVLLMQPGRIWLLNKEGGDYETEEIALDGAVGGRLYDDGVVVLTDDGSCGVSWVDDETTSTTVENCDPKAFDVDPQTGTVYVGGADGSVAVVTPGGSADTEVAGDLVVWDAASEVTYVATGGDSLVQAIEPDGALRWSTELDGVVRALSPAGRVGAAAVMLELSDGTGELVYLDGQDGEPITTLPTPSAAAGLTVSGNGGTLALILPDQTHFYSVHVQ